mmetsp:Transcript_3805/g.6791  ORF Transcript_3805/g.6791 Transcript_3805/m.6791 type:complete len:302 (+) Transcript_3805:2-907(+)
MNTSLLRSFSFTALIGTAAAFAHAPVSRTASSLGLGMASAAADTFVRAWVSGERLGPDDFPPAPTSVDGLYETHLAIQVHPLVDSELGGLGGYKLGAIGGAGEPCIYAPLFRGFFVDERDNAQKMSTGAINLSAVEAEYGVVMGSDLPPRSDNGPYSAEEVWAAVDEVVLCIECCGKRGTPDAYAASTKLGSFADTLSSGGIVLGPRLSASTFEMDDLFGATKLFVNDEVVAEGSGANVPEGGPLQALTYLANHLNGRGLGLRQGELVATGQTCATKAFEVGDVVRATFGPLGEAKMVVAE